MSHTVLVTGTSGSIGSYTVRNLTGAGYRVVGMDILPASASSRFIQGAVG